VLFPLNNRAFASMAKMRSVAPKMKEIRERHKDDPQAQQKAMMELYRKEKINPVAAVCRSCRKSRSSSRCTRPCSSRWTRAMRRSSAGFRTCRRPIRPMFGNLFGLLPYDPSGIPMIGRVLAIGIWPMLMGVTMWAQQSLNPPPPDKIQRQIFAFLPIIFTIVMAPFPAALIIYWSWNNFADHRPAILHHAPPGRGDRAGPQLLQGPRQADRLGRARKISGPRTPRTATNQVIEGKVEEAVTELAEDANADAAITDGETPANTDDTPQSPRLRVAGSAPTPRPRSRAAARRNRRRP
jgi:YidC/Oxa1 family membrane protein insertase